MPEQGFPSLEEFWQRVERRELEPDLRGALRERAAREQGPVSRAGSAPTVIAVAARLVPGAVPPGTLATFLDEHFDRQLGWGDERIGVLPRAVLIPAGFEALDDAASQLGAASFSKLEAPQQDDLLARAERGELPGPEGFNSSAWFQRVRDLLLLGFGSDPRGMVQMGFPGPSYRPGHVWLDTMEVKARAERKPGYLDL